MFTRRVFCGAMLTIGTCGLSKPGLAQEKRAVCYNCVRD